MVRVISEPILAGSVFITSRRCEYINKPLANTLSFRNSIRALWKDHEKTAFLWNVEQSSKYYIEPHGIYLDVFLLWNSCVAFIPECSKITYCMISMFPLCGKYIKKRSLMSKCCFWLCNRIYHTLHVRTSQCYRLWNSENSVGFSLWSRNAATMKWVVKSRISKIVLLCHK